MRKVPSKSAHIHADRRLVFQTLTAFGAQTADGSQSEVLDEHQDEKLVRFTTPFSIVGVNLKLVSVERVRLEEPHIIDFRLERASGLMAIFSELHDVFELEDADGCTTMTYHSEFKLRGGRLGEVLGSKYVTSLLAGFMVKHLAEMKATAESRAKRSRVYPAKQSCPIA